MARKIPSFAALEAFEAVARLGSATLAANELGRTQSAVSRQLKAIEDYMRRPLFMEDRKRLQVNAAGRAYAGAIANILFQLEQVTAQTAAYGEDDPRLALGVLPTFGMRWLVPRLPAFASSELGFELSLATLSDADQDLRSLGLDAAIRLGSGDWPEVSIELVREEVTVVVTPALHQKLGPHLDRYVLLNRRRHPALWKHWLPANVRFDPDSGTKLENFMMVTEAALMGLGAALIPTMFVQAELDSGKLIQPFGEARPSGASFYFCYPHASIGKPKIVALQRWLLEMSAGDLQPSTSAA